MTIAKKIRAIFHSYLNTLTKTIFSQFHFKKIEYFANTKFKQKKTEKK